MRFWKASAPAIAGTYFASSLLPSKIAAMDLLLTHETYQIMLAYVQSRLPLEACGLLAGRDGLISHIYFIDNILRSPVEFEMDAQQQIEAMIHAEEHELALLAVFHSHPLGPQTPSQTDVAKAYYPDMAQIIIALANPAEPSVRAFTIAEQEISELALHVLAE
jgi:proteasome lid subunit RPN8/RPN11